MTERCLEDDDRMTQNAPLLRPATPADAPELAELSGQLGYPSTSAQIVARLERLGDADWVRVAESDGRVVAWIHVRGTTSLESEPWAEIVGLVVDEAVRGQKIGQELVEAACLWARERGYGEVKVRSNAVRAAAHRFYERQGFRTVKTQAVFSRRP
jgi:predicted N-acetyltransferase YhbS